MDFAGFGMILDIAFILLLVAVLVYAIRLNRHISALHSNKAELEKLLGGFVASTERAEEAIQKVRKNTEENIKAVHDAVGKAETLHADLSYMLDRGEEIANRLESGIRSGRTAYQATGRTDEQDLLASAVAAGEKEAAGAEAADKGKSEGKDVKAKSKADLLKALQGMR